MYFIALAAPVDIHQQVLKWKHWMKERYQCTVALRSPAHITLVPPFWMKPALEKDLTGAIADFSKLQQTFTVQLNDFSHFKSNVLFVDVIVHAPLLQLREALFDFLHSTGRFPLKEDKRPFHPHVTIATRDMHKKAFEEAWEHFRDKPYAASWEVRAISLLKHNGSNWDIAAALPFAL